MQDGPPGAKWQILRLLRDVRALDFESLVARTGLGAQTITRQLKILKTIGFVGHPVSTRNDRHEGYSLTLRGQRCMETDHGSLAMQVLVFFHQLRDIPVFRDVLHRRLRALLDRFEEASEALKALYFEPILISTGDRWGSLGVPSWFAPLGRSDRQRIRWNHTVSLLDLHLRTMGRTSRQFICSVN